MFVFWEKKISQTYDFSELAGCMDIVSLLFEASMLKIGIIMEV